MAKVLYIVLLVLLWMLPACMAEDDISKKCDLTSKKPNHGCIAGYECIAAPQGEECRRKPKKSTKKLTSLDHNQSEHSATVSEHYHKFLQHLGYIE